jgi:glycosyltransferase involved in cell wall biosynthesis
VASSTPLVTLIMPAWRPQALWLHEAVQSALSQRDCEVELVVVDDGSECPVAELLAPVSDPRLRVLRVPHGGQGAALNAGIAAARGEWLRFVDADDVITPDSTAHLAGLTSGRARTIAYGATLMCDAALNPRTLVASTLQGTIVSECLLGQFHARHVSMLFPRRVVHEAGPWDTQCRVSADWDFVLRALEHAEVRGDTEVATLYRRHGRSVSGQADVQAGELSRRRMIERYFDRHPRERGTRLERQAWAALYLDRGLAYWSARHYGAALGRLGRSIANDPSIGIPGISRFLAARATRGAKGL